MLAAWTLHAAAQALRLGDDLARGEAAYRRGSFEQAAELWRPLAEAGDPYAQFGMGLLYFGGNGVQQDTAESTRWFRLAAEQGYGPAQFNLGNAHKHGRGVPLDEAEAARWWRLAAEQDYAAAQYNLGLQYYYGLGVAHDADQADAWLRRAAENGHAGAIELLASASAAGEAQPAPSDTVREVTAPAADAPDGAALGEDWIARQDPSAYTLQLLASRRESSVVAAIARHAPPAPVAYYRFERGGEQWVALLQGAYATPAEARAAIERLPDALRAGPPWVRSFRAVQAIIDER